MQDVHNSVCFAIQLTLIASIVGVHNPNAEFGTLRFNFNQLEPNILWH